MALPALALAISLQRFLAQSLAKLCKTD
jgi:hypothetical protein